MRATRRLMLASLLLSVMTAGCQENPVDIHAPGTIIITPQPDTLDAGWELMECLLPGIPVGDVRTGEGRDTLENMPMTSYMITWREVPIYDVTPPREMRMLMPGGELKFEGVYGVGDEPVPPDGFAYIPPGTFMMGSPPGEPGREAFGYLETQHEVTLTHGFYMSRYEVTEEWWYQVMGGTPTTSPLPRNYVSWDGAVQFCNALSLQENLTPAYTIHGPNGNVTWNRDADGYRLPTEAEWEYACRAGSTLAFTNNTNCLSSNDEANFRGNAHQLPGCPTGVYRGGRTAVGSFPANDWGLYDMHGNLYEWVWDSYRADYHNLDPVDPVYDVGPGTDRVIRGGSWGDVARFNRSAARYSKSTGTSVIYWVGFRPVRGASR